MKKILSFYLTATLLLSAQMLKAQSTNDIKCEPKPNGTCDCQVLSYDGIKKALKTSNPKADFKVFWDFGDGTYAENQPGQRVVSHRYNAAKSYIVKAYFIVEYANQKFLPATTSVNIGKVSGGESESVGGFSVKSSLANVGRIRPEDYFVVVVSTPSAGKVSLDFDPSVFAIYGDPRGTAGVSLSGTTIDSRGKQNIFIAMSSLKFGMISAKPESTTIKARLNGQNSNVLSFVKNAAYDPNDMRADVRRLKWSEFNGKTDFPIKYTVRFENIGVNEANHVAIKVKIPAGLTYKTKGNDGSYGLVAYGFGNTDVTSPNNIVNYDCPICKDTSNDTRCLRITEPVDGDRLGIDFQKIQLAPKTRGKGNKGYIKYNLFLNKKIEKKTLVSYADIVFDDNGKVITTNASKVRFKPQPRLSLRFARNSYLPFKVADTASYEVGLVLSRLRPYGFYFPTEIGVSVIKPEKNSVPIRLAQQIRHNFLGGFLGVGVGLSANVSLNTSTETKKNGAVSYSNLIGFVDINVNALKQRPTVGVRLGQILDQKFKPVNGAKGQFQIYAAYQF